METIKTLKYLFWLTLFYFDTSHFLDLYQNFDPHQFYGPMPPMPKFQPGSPMPFFGPTPKFYGPTPSMSKFRLTPPTPRFYRLMPPTPPTPKFDPCHPWTHAPMLPTPFMLFSRLYIINSFHLFLIFSLDVYMLFVYLSLFATIKIYNMSILDLTHSLISLSCKFWYQLLTVALFIMRKLEIINKLPKLKREKPTTPGLLIVICKGNNFQELLNNWRIRA